MEHIVDNSYFLFYCQFRRSTSLFRNSVLFSEILTGCSLAVFTSSLIYCLEHFIVLEKRRGDQPRKKGFPAGRYRTGLL